MNEVAKRHGEIPIQSLYTAGVGGEIFLSALKNRGELVATRCPPCEQVYLPARLFCERCFAELTEQMSVAREGVIKSFTTVHCGRHGEALEKPLTLALVQLDGATTVLLHRLLESANAPRVAIGDRVSLVIKPEGERTGSILDIEGFRHI
jgi:uncharacterized OB-fold protein